MGDSGEGLVDNEARIQERMEELRQDRENQSKINLKTPQIKRQVDSLRLARVELSRQLGTVTHEGRKAQLNAAIADLDRRMAEVQAS